MNYELSEKLKKAGFPQKKEIVEMGKVMDTPIAYEPTLEELKFQKKDFKKYHKQCNERTWNNN